MLDLCIANVKLELIKMLLENPNPKKRNILDCIEAILTTGSFSLAAKQLCVTQSAISQQIAKIEKHYSIQIFHRKKKPIQLTEEGQVYIQMMRKMRALEQQCDQYFSDRKALKHGRLRIGSNPCRTATLLAPTLKRFISEYPGIDIDLVEIESKDVAQALMDNRADLCLTLQSRLTPAMNSRFLSAERVFIAARRNSPIAHKGSRPKSYRDVVAPADFILFKDEPFVLINHGTKFNEYYFDLCRKFNIEPKVILRAETMDIVHKVVSQGLGCALVPEELAYCHYQDSTGPVYFDLSKEFPNNPVVVAWLSENYLSRGARRFIEMLEETAMQCYCGYCEES